MMDRLNSLFGKRGSSIDRTKEKYFTAELAENAEKRVKHRIIL